jgi:hypothetical protein
VFHDLGHVSVYGVPAVGEFIAGEILARLRDGAPAGAVAGTPVVPHSNAAR